MTRSIAHQVRFTLHKLEYAAGQSPTAKLTVNFDADRKLLNLRTVAAHSSHGWGQWQSSEKLPTDLGHAWWCSTAGHGGVILVTQQKLPEVFSPAQDLTVYRTPSGGWLANWDKAGLEMARRDGRDLTELPLYVYEFEEDCDYAQICLLDRQVAEAMGKRLLRPRDADAMQEACRRVVAAWASPAVCEYLGVTPAGDNVHKRDVA